MALLTPLKILAGHSLGQLAISPAAIAMLLIAVLPRNDDDRRGDIRSLVIARGPFALEPRSVLSRLEMKPLQNQMGPS